MSSARRLDDELTGTAAPAAAPRVDVREVQAAMEGDRRAAARLWDRYAPVVHGILLAMVPAETVPDLVQDVWLSALRALPALEEPAAFPGWLRTIARNRGRDAQRARGAEPLAATEPEPLAPEGETDLADAVLALIRELPESYREPLVLRLVAGLTGPEISERTGLTLGSVRVNLCRGMKRLRKRLTDEDLP